MKFSGRLQIEADPIQWLKTDLSLAQGRLELTSGNEILGSWSTTQVKAERIDGDRFELLLGEDRALFAADDALAFSYEALPHLSKKHIIAGPTGLRGRLRHGLRGNERHDAQPSNRGTHTKGGGAPVPVVSEPASVTVEPAASETAGANHPVARRLRELIQAANQERELVELSSTDPSEGKWPEEAWTEEKGPEAPEPDNDVLAIEEWPGIGELAASNPAASDLAPIESIFEAEPIESGLGEFAFGEVEAPLLGASDIESIELEAAELAEDIWARPSVPAPEPPLPEIVRPPSLSPGRLDLEPAFGKADAASDDPEVRVMAALEGVLAEVRNGSMSPAQVSAVTDLVQAVTDFVGARPSTGN